MAQGGSFTIMDYNREKSSFTYNVGEVTAVTLPSILSGNTDLEEALQAIIEGVISRRQLDVFDNAEQSPTPPTEKYAQRETKWLVRFRDVTTNKLYRSEIPTAKLSLLTANEDTLDLSAGAGLAFKTAFEAHARSVDNNNVVIISVQHVGRNS